MSDLAVHLGENEDAVIELLGSGHASQSQMHVSRLLAHALDYLRRHLTA